MTLLTVSALEVSFAGRRVLGPIDLALAPGQLVGVVGANGAGKSSLLKGLAGLVDARWRECRLLGRDPAGFDARARARVVGYLPQNPALAWPLTVRELAALGRLPHGDGDTPADLAAVDVALAAMGLTAHASRPVDTLSGGEQMRAHLARLVAGAHRLLLVDEPTTSLDPRFQLEVLAYLRRLAHDGHCALLVLHDLSLAARYCDRLLVLEQGRVVHDAAPPALDDAHLARVFGVRGIRATVDGADVLVGISSLDTSSCKQA
jgi:iron complex transport system ATP-binding protein